MNVGQGKLCFPGWVEMSGAKPQPPKDSCYQQQDKQQSSEDKGLHSWDSSCIYTQVGLHAYELLTVSGIFKL